MTPSTELLHEGCPPGQTAQHPVPSCGTHKEVAAHVVSVSDGDLDRLGESLAGQWTQKENKKDAQKAKRFQCDPL